MISEAYSLLRSCWILYFAMELSFPDRLPRIQGVTLEMSSRPDRDVSSQSNSQSNSDYAVLSPQTTDSSSGSISAGIEAPTVATR